MKKNLVKVMVAAMAFAAALAMTSCANPAGSTPANTPAGGSESKFDLGLTSMDGWGKYDISDKSATGFTMKSTGAQALNDCGGADITFGTAKKVTFKVTNNASEECWMQVIIKKDGAEGSGTRITSASIDGTNVDGDITWGVNTTIAAGASKVFVLNLTGTDADKFVFSLNSNADNSKTSGNVTISEAYMYK